MPTPDPGAPRPKAPPDVTSVPDDTTGLDTTTVYVVEVVSRVDKSELNRLAFVLWAQEDCPLGETSVDQAIRKYAALNVAKTVLQFRHHWDESRRPLEIPNAAEYK